ncbi:MAG: hypothetical protein EA396_13090 [Anaerolineaceae bacterium]|nr:MAG: hypothetical protein EA396_13090 [Anaerolineaceae bacterium]
MSLLQRIQQLQFTQKAEAERLLLDFINGVFPLQVVACELRPQVISLNSFNGFITLADGERKFFKTHTEQDNVIDEYYNAGLLADAGYPVIQPIHSSTTAGQHLLIYDVIESPSVFDVAWAIERGDDAESLPALTAAQNRADDALWAIYQQTIGEQSAADSANAPIHQLFYHRLAGGRLKRFYGQQTTVKLIDAVYDLREVRSVRWSINGQIYGETLNDIIKRAINLLQPTRADVSIIGHGDAHNGNVFFADGQSLLYFDPAFAGRHHPLLDIVKPIFHNVFAMWMYYPAEKRRTTPVRFSRGDDLWTVAYDYNLHPVRRMFLQSKVERVLTPLVIELARRGQLRSDWRAYFKAALFCCPFLTLNLADADRFPPEISLLGLAMAVEMGGESDTARSAIDTILDNVERSL